MAGNLNLFVDIERGMLVQEFASTLGVSLPRFFNGDQIPVTVRVLEPDTATLRPYRDISLAGQSVRIGIGVSGGKPTYGTFRLKFGGDTSAQIPYNAPAGGIAAALNALASIAAAGGVTVEGSALSTFRVYFDDNGVRADIEAITDGLAPLSGARIATVQAGNGDRAAIQLIRIETEPVAYAELTDDLPAAGAIVSTIRDGDVEISEIQSIELLPVPYDGTFAVEMAGGQTPALNYNATAEELQGALESIPGIGAGNVVVTGAFPRWTITFAASLENAGEALVDVSDLTVPTGRTGLLSTNTAGIIELLAGDSTASARLEIELYDIAEGRAHTAVQMDCTLAEDIIPNEPASQPEMFAGFIRAISGGDAPENEGSGYLVSGVGLDDDAAGFLIAAGADLWTDDGSLVTNPGGGLNDGSGTWQRAAINLASDGLWRFAWREGGAVTIYETESAAPTPDLVPWDAALEIEYPGEGRTLEFVPHTSDGTPGGPGTERHVGGTIWKKVGDSPRLWRKIRFDYGT